jgi:MFS superfamily sulfate permease-like transporter
VLDGMLIAIALSIAAMVRRLATPQLVELGQLASGHDFVDVARHPEAVRVPGIAIWRPAEPLFFANAERVLGEVETRLHATPGAHALVLSLEESFDIDSTALDALTEFAERIAKAGIRLHLARVHDHVRDLLSRAGADALASASSYSVADAVATMKESV